MTVLPWQLVCMNHPFGHDHHEQDGPSVCELHKIASQQEGQHVLPPMDCEHVALMIDDYNSTQVTKVVPPIQLFAFVAVLFDLVSVNVPQQPFLVPPDPRCRSATLLRTTPPRAPPLA